MANSQTKSFISDFVVLPGCRRTETCVGEGASARRGADMATLAAARRAVVVISIVLWCLLVERRQGVDAQSLSSLTAVSQTRQTYTSTGTGNNAGNTLWG